MDTILKVILGLFGLGIIVFIHELGHFIAARISGVVVETFSIGWGPVLFRKKKGDTEYRISLIPMGGYCGMKGDKDLQKALSEKLNEVPQEVGSFYAASPLKRMFIGFSGPFMNVLSAILAFAIIWMIGYSYTSAPNRIITIGEDQRAYQSGLRSGDRIVSVDGKPTVNFTDAAREIGIHPNESISLGVERDGEIQTISVVPELNTETGTGFIGITSWIPLKIAEVKSDSFFALAGIQAGDVIMAINGKTITNTYEMQQVLSNSSNQIDVTYMRGEAVHTVPVVLAFSANGTASLGIQFEYESFETARYGFFTSLAKGVVETVEMMALTVKSIGLLFQGVNVTNAVSGPVRITVMFGDVVQSGFSAGFRIGLSSVLNFLALISVSLFMMNLLPIPILDGGLILFSFIELIRGKPVKPRVMYYVQFIGVAFIAFIFIFALFSDVKYLFFK